MERKLTVTVDFDDIETAVKQFVERETGDKVEEVELIFSSLKRDSRAVAHCAEPIRPADQAIIEIMEAVEGEDVKLIDVLSPETSVEEDEGEVS